MFVDDQFCSGAFFKIHKQQLLPLEYSHC